MTAAPASRCNGPGPRSRRAALALAGLTMVGLPAIGFLTAPSAHAADSPGANLAGIDASASATAVQVSPLTPGLVGAGNVSQGNLVEADIPYASTSSSTGPSAQAVASPAYPGDTAAGAGNAIATFAPQFPPQMVALLNDPVLARADYPAQVSAGTSSTYAPPSGAGAGVGTASADAGDSGSEAASSISRNAFGASVVTVGSSRATSKTVLAASSVTGSSHSDVGTIELLGGLVKIAGITSDASASSDGNTGQPTSDFHLGAVTVGGVAASIGPDGITLQGSGPVPTLISGANQALVALKQAGISVHTIAPVSTVDGASATVTSGALSIAFQDANIPNPNGQIPVSSIGLDLNLGLSQATADATALPPIGSLGGTLGGSPPGVGSGLVGSGGGSSALPVGSAVTPSASGTTPSLAGPTTASPAGPVTSSTGGSSAPPTVASPAASLLGVPIKVAWVVIACLLSLVVSGPLLGYANWQLLRGRKS